jgi:hypothetical protein
MGIGTVSLGRLVPAQNASELRLKRPGCGTFEPLSSDRLDAR